MANREIKFRTFKNGMMSRPFAFGEAVCFPDGSVSVGRGFELMQYTGLKDANGVEIYEADIISWHGAVCYVAWEKSDASFMAVEQYDSWAESGQEWGGDCKVIGNIYQNQELLK